MIFKIVIPRSIFNKENDDIKLVFLGDLNNLKVDNTDKFYELLREIETKGIEDISSKDETFLNNIIPGFKSKIGDTKTYKLKFIYQSIPENIIIRNLNIFILDLLLQFNEKFKDDFAINFTSLKQYGILGYYYNISINRTHIVDIINYIYNCEGADTLLSVKKMILGLKNNLYLKLPESNISNNIKYFELGTDENLELTAIEYLSNSKLRQFLNENIPQLLCYHKSKIILSFLEEDNIKKEDTIKYFENFGCYFYKKNDKTQVNILTQMRNSIFIYDSSFTKKYDINMDLSCNLSNLYDNTLYMYLGQDIQECQDINMNVKRVLNEMCFKIKDSSSLNNISNENAFWLQAFINRNNFITNYNYVNNNNAIEKHNKTFNFMITINKQYWNKLTFSLYLNQQGLTLNLSLLFKNSKVSFYCPVVKYINNQEVQNYNLYLPFIKALNSKLVKLYFNNTDILDNLNENIYINHINPELKRLKYNKLLSYLLYKIILDINNPSLILNIFIFETGYIIFNINNTNNIIIGQEIIEKAFTFLNVIIKKIKTLFNLKKIELPNPEKSILFSSYKKNIKIYKSLLLIEQNTSFDINLNFKSYYVFQNFVKKIIENKAFDTYFNKQLLAIKSEEYQKEFYLFITRNKLKDNKNILPLLNNVISRNVNYKKTFLTDNEIRYIYTQIDGFEHKSNIIQYMFSKISNISNLTKSKEHVLILETAYLFNKTVEEIKNVFNTLLKLDIQGNNKFHYLCSFVIKTDIENKCFNITFQGSYDIDIVNNIINHINFSFNQLFTEIINETYHSIIINNNMLKSINALDNIFNKQLNNDSNIENIIKATIEDIKIVSNIFDLDIYSKNKKLEHDDSISRNKNKSLSVSIDDLENINLDNELEHMNLDIDIDFDLDIDIDFDVLNELETLDKLDNNIDNKQTAKYDNKQTVKYDNKQIAKYDIDNIQVKDIIGKTKKLTESEYIKLMRRKFDSSLYEPIVESSVEQFKADDSCPKTERRIPYIVTKEQLKTFNPKAFNGYLKYRNNYYICPRLWDAKSEKPISVEDFIKHGMKSPYSEGELVTSSLEGKYITDKYNVILRKPTTNKKWSDPGLHKDWPDVLRHTEKEAYPGLTKGNKHPQKLCLPCCFSNKPEGYDHNKLEIQEIKKPRGYNACKQYINISKTSDIKLYDMDTMKYDNYVSNAYTVLKYGRLGLLPNDLDILLNNMQELFLSENGNTLLENSNLFLRLGLTNNREFNILESISSCLNISLQKFINLIINKLLPDDFIILNNGSLLDEFYVGNNLYLPYDTNDLNKFIKFCEFYDNIFIYLNIVKYDFMLELNKFKLNIASKLYKDNDIYYNNFESDLKILYKIFISYYNYLKFINNSQEIKQLHHVIELFTVPRKWLFKQGVNILIFNKDCKSIKCGYTTNLKTSKLLMLLEEDNNIYIPIIQVKIYQQNRIVRNTIIELNNDLNLNNKSLNYYKTKKPQFKKVLPLLEERLEQVVKLLYIKNQVCRFDLKIVNDNMFKYLKINNLALAYQFNNFSGVSGNISFIGLILLNSAASTNSKSSISKDYNKVDLILPIYNNHILKNVLLFDFISLNKMIYNNKITFSYLIKLFYNARYNKIEVSDSILSVLYLKLDGLKKFGYNIDTVNIEKINNVFIITGVYFTNGLLMILKPEIFDKELYNTLHQDIVTRYKININISNQILINYCKYNITKLDDNKLDDKSLITKLDDKSLITKLDDKSLITKLDDKSLITKLDDKSLINNKDYELLELYEYGLDILECYILINLSEIISKNKKKYIDIYEFFAVEILDYYSDDIKNKTLKINKSNDILRLGIIEIYKSLKNLIKSRKDILITNNINEDSLLKIIDKLNKKVEYKLLNYKYEFTIILNSLLNEQNNNIIILLDSSIETIILNIISKLILDSRLRNDFLNNKLIKFNVYNTLYFEDIIKKNNMNPLKQYVIENNIGLICNKEELNYIIKNYLLSVYRNEYYILDTDTELLNFEYNKLDIPTHISEIIKNKLKIKTDNTNIKIKNIYNLTNTQSIISSSKASSISNENIIISTVFNSKGLYNPKAQVGECILPYKNINGKLSYNCNPADKIFNKQDLKQNFLNPTDLVCPTKINKHHKPDEFGYCPEKQIITKDRFNIKPRFTTTENKQCIFPYLFFNKKIINPLSGSTPLLKVNFNCFKKRKEEGSWCFVENKNVASNELVVSSKVNQTFLIGATKNDDIFYGIWSMDKILDNTNKRTKHIDKKKLKDIFELLNYKESKCLDIDINLSEQKKIEKHLDLDNVSSLKLEEYDHSFCMMSESKKGYSKKQLYIFGRDILGLPYTLLINKNKKILSKQELCKLFEGKINELKKLDTLRKLKVDEVELDLTNIYTKDPDQCNKGEGKGGYKLLDLRTIATTFLGLKFDDAFSMNKQQLCNYIIPKIFHKETNNTNTNNNKELINKELLNKESIYPVNKDIYLCEKPINRGGLDIKTVRNIANKLNINHKNKLKEDICEEIRSKLENYKNTYNKETIDNIDNKLKLDNLNKYIMTNNKLEAYTNNNFDI